MMGQSALTIVILAGICFNIANAGAATTGAPGELRCQEDDGTMLPSATVCDDDLDSTTCTAVFGPAVTPTATSRSPNCDLDDLQDKALQCAKTCGICCEKPEYDCDDSKTAPINCTVNKRKCTDANWTAVMTQYCPSTCGLCNAGGACSDKISGCRDMAGLCENVNFYQYMLDNCARTCGTCTSTTSSPGGSTCSDVATNCATNAALCNNATYRDLMTQKCPSTCGRCGSTSGGSSCTDTNANCATWVANGFCSNSFYTSAQKQQYCGRSCSLC